MTENIELRFCDYSQKNSISPNDSEKELFILTPSKREDNKYRCRFNVYHHNDDKQPTHIGMIKIYLPSLDVTDHDICQQIMRQKSIVEDNKGDFLSVGGNIYFYYNLQNKLKDNNLGIQFLKRIHDINQIDHKESFNESKSWFIKENSFGKLQLQCTKSDKLNVLDLTNINKFPEFVKLLYSDKKNKWEQFFKDYIKSEDISDGNRLYLTLIFVKAIKKVGLDNISNNSA
ncbi:hypothetical protein, partial [Lactobacillus helveticus]